MFGDRRGGLFAKTNLISETNGLSNLIRETNGLQKCPPGAARGSSRTPSCSGATRNGLRKTFWGGINKCLGIGGADFDHTQVT